MAGNRDRVISVLEDMAYYGNIPKCGIDNIIIKLEDMGFFVKPGSLNFHHKYTCGLVEHSLEVMDILLNLNDKLGLGLCKHSIKTVSLFHDLCKCDDYKMLYDGFGTSGCDDLFSFVRNYDKKPGHGNKSVDMLVEMGVVLGDYDIQAIRTHMGAYVDDYTPLNQAYDRDNNRLAYWLHVADMLSAHPGLKGGM